jgi:hypothetical protein
MHGKFCDASPGQILMEWDAYFPINMEKETPKAMPLSTLISASREFSQQVFISNAVLEHFQRIDCMEKYKNLLIAGKAHIS